MVDADGGVKSGGCDGARHCCAQYRVAVIEQAVLVLGLPVAPEVLAEEHRPVFPRGLSFQVIRVTRADALRHGEQTMIFPAHTRQVPALRCDLRADNLRPQAFLRRLRGIHLLLEPLRLRRVPHERKEHPNRRTTPDTPRRTQVRRAPHDS